MYSRQSFTSYGRDVDGGHLLRIADVGPRSIVIGADGGMLASGPKFLDTWLENQKANSALSTAPSSRSTKPIKVPLEDLRIKPLDSPKAGTTQSSLRPLMNVGTSWLSSSFPGSALRQQPPNNYCHFWPKPWFSSGTTRATTPMNSDSLSRTTAAWPAYRLVQIEQATDGAIRSFIASDTWWKTSFSASSIGAARRPVTRNSCQPSSLSKHQRPQSITSDATNSTRPNVSKLSGCAQVSLFSVNLTQPPVSKLISSLPIEHHAVRVSRHFWEPWFAKAGLYTELEAIFEGEEEVCLSRERILKQCTDARRKCLETLLWGYPKGMRGNRHEAYLGNVEEISRLASSNAEWRDYFHALSALKGLGMSTITKLAYFFRKEFDRHPSLILDQRILNVLSRDLWSELEALKHIRRSNAHRHYPLYLQTLNFVAQEIRDASGDKLEFFLFLLGDSFCVSIYPDAPVV